MDESACEAMSLKPEFDWFDKEYWAKQSAIVGSAEGRGTTHFIQHNKKNLVLRHYCRGGLIGRFNKDWFLGSKVNLTRPFRELSLLKYMNEVGLPVPTGVAGLVRKSLGGYRADILSVRIPHATDIHTLLLKQYLDSDVWVQLGKAIKQMHDAQVHHHDLNIKNIMLDKDNKVWIIDFDKCEKRDGNNWKQSNVDRLHRSLNKQLTIHEGYCFKDKDWDSINSGYFD